MQLKIQNVFLTSQLKKHVGDVVTFTYLPYQVQDAFTEKKQEENLDRIIVKRKRATVTKVVKLKPQLPEMHQLEVLL